jgi:hypothetical protein
VTYRPIDARDQAKLLTQAADMRAARAFDRSKRLGQSIAYLENPEMPVCLNVN